VMSSVILLEEVHPVAGIAMAVITICAAAVHYRRSRRTADTPTGKLASLKS
jgi:hypothetical protein